VGTINKSYKTCQLARSLFGCWLVENYLSDHQADPLPDYQDQNKYYFTKIGFTER